MKSLITSALLLALALSCSSQNSEIETIDKEFNAQAKETYQREYSERELLPLTVREKCILDETISHDLDELNNHTISAFKDTLEFRRFDDKYVGWPFTFLRDRYTGTTYFFFLADLPHFIFNVEQYYSADSDTLYSLNSPLQAIQINCLGCKNLFSHKLFTRSGNQEKDFYSKVRLAHVLLAQIEPSLYFRTVENEEVREYLRRALREGLIDNRDYEAANSVLHEPFGRRVCTSFSISGLGYIIFCFSADERTNSLIFESYFIPSISRPKILRSVHPKHLKCFQ